MDLRNFFKPVSSPQKPKSSVGASNTDDVKASKIQSTSEIKPSVKKDSSAEAKNVKKTRRQKKPVEPRIMELSEEYIDEEEVLFVPSEDVSALSSTKTINDKKEVHFPSQSERVPRTLEAKVNESRLSTKRSIEVIESAPKATEPTKKVDPVVEEEDVVVVSKKKRRRVALEDSDDDFKLDTTHDSDMEEFRMNVVDEEDDDDIMIDDLEEETPKKKTRGRPKKTATTTTTTTTKRPRATKKQAAPTNDAEDDNVKVVKVAVTNRSAGYPPWMAPAKDPPHKGSKVIPVGKPGCLEGLAFVLTGVHDSIDRDDMKALIEQYGGVVRTAVSGKTSYLVAGMEMDDGRRIEEGTKYKAAVAKNVPIIDEDKLLDMIRSSCPQPANPVPPVKKEESQEQKQVVPSKDDVQVKEEPVTSKSQSSQPLSQPIKHLDETLFTSKYAPQSLNDLVGNARQITAFKDWLLRWKDVHIHKTIKVQYTRQNPGAKACLISGPPGSGKTTTVSVLAKMLNYELIELNASDKRNMSIVRDLLNNIINNNSLSSLQSYNYNKLILMDEVDGMSSGDRGGIAELIRIIKTTTVPIVCVCNDHDSQKIRSLVNYCYDLNFTKPTSMEVQKRVNYIITQEHIKISPENVNTIIASTDGDMRQILNQLQMLYTLQSQNIQYSINDITNSMNQKDVVLGTSAFDATKILFQGSAVPFNKRYESFFIDYEMTPLLLYQNYVDSYKTNSQNAKSIQYLEGLAAAAESMSDLDLVNNAIRSRSDYSLLTVEACLAVRSTDLARGRGIWPRFPALLGKMSTRNKNKRLISELTSHSKLITNTNNLGMRMDYFGPLKRHLLYPLLRESNVDETIKAIDEYHLTKDDFILTLNGISLPTDTENFDKVPSKVKSGFTRKYNSMSHINSNMFENDADMFTRVTRGKKGAKGKSKEKSKPTLEDDDSFIDDNEDDDEVYYY